MDETFLKPGRRDNVLQFVNVHGCDDMIVTVADLREELSVPSCDICKQIHISLAALALEITGSKSESTKTVKVNSSVTNSYFTS